MIVTTDEAATLAGISPVTLRKWVMQGDIEPVRRGANPLKFEYDEVARVQRDKRPKVWQRQHVERVTAWLTGNSPHDMEQF